MTERKSLESSSSQRKSAENSEKLLQLLFSAISAAFLSDLSDSKLSHPARKSRSEEI
jgi:hypothetical protein